MEPSEVMFARDKLHVVRRSVRPSSVSSREAGSPPADASPVRSSASAYLSQPPITNSPLRYPVPQHLTLDFSALHSQGGR